MKRLESEAERAPHGRADLEGLVERAQDLIYRRRHPVALGRRLPPPDWRGRRRCYSSEAVSIGEMGVGDW